MKHGGNPNLKSLYKEVKECDGDTPLISVLDYYSYNPDTMESVQLLFDAGADVNAKGNDGEYALDKAVEYRLYDEAVFLIEKGADWDYTDWDIFPRSRIDIPFLFRVIRKEIEEKESMTLSQEEKQIEKQVRESLNRLITKLKEQGAPIEDARQGYAEMQKILEKMKKDGLLEFFEMDGGLGALRREYNKKVLSKWRERAEERKRLREQDKKKEP